MTSHVPRGPTGRANLKNQLLKIEGFRRIDFAGERRGKPVTYRERWTLEDGGKHFRVARHLVSPRGETDQTLAMVKQSANSQ